MNVAVRHSTKLGIEVLNESTAQSWITKETEHYLRRKGLWNYGAAWTKKTMRELAQAQEKRGRIPLLSFEQVFFAVKCFAAEQLIPLMNEYALTVQYTAHIKDALEYAVQYRQEHLLAQLLELHEDRAGLGEWMLVYRLLLASMVQDCLSDEYALEQTKDMHGRVTETILKARLAVHEVYSYIGLGHYSKAALLKEQLPKQLETVEDSFVKRIVTVMANFYIAYDFVYNEGDIIQAERYLYELVIPYVAVEVMFPPCYHLLAIAALVRQDYMSVKYAERAISYAEETSLEGYRQQLISEFLPFVRNMQREKFDLNGVVPEERVHQHVVRGEREKALLLVNELESNGYTSEFLVFYQAKAMQSIEHLCEVLLDLSRKGWAHLLPIVKQELLYVHRIKDDELKRVQQQFRSFKWQAMLSPRELEVLEKIHEGSTQSAIAKALYMSPSTVKKHVNSILKKTGLKRSKEAAAVAKKLSLF
ncbi:AimR family lysis-lysogeny pheromone receptor [Bacillus sp. FSL W7-1360]